MVEASKRCLDPQIVKDILGSPRLFVILSILYPSVYLIGINSHMYTTEQIAVTFVFIFAVSLIITLSMGIFMHYFAKLILGTVKHLGFASAGTVFPSLYRALLGGAGTLILLVLLHTANRVLVPLFHDVIWGLLYLILSFGVGVLTYRYHLRMLNFVLIILIAANSAWGLLHGFAVESINHATKEMEQNIVFKQKPNVYLVILESYASLPSREKTYGINNHPLMRELNQKDYVTYRTFANYHTSLASVASLFMMRHHYYKLSRGDADGYYRHIIGGGSNNPVINIFLNNGYRVDYNGFSPSLYHPSPRIETQLVLPLLKPLEVFGKLFKFLNRILKHFSLDTAFFRSLLGLPETILKKPVKTSENTSTQNDGRPVFSAIYAGARHSPRFLISYPHEIRGLPSAQRLPLWKLNQMDDYWIKTYKNVIAQSDVALIEMVRCIDEKDPDAIVILAGDHGPWLQRDRWMGGHEDLNKNMLENGIQPAEVTTNIFEVFMAVKWPRGFDRTDEYFTHVNLFRYVFAALTKDHAIIKSRVADDSFMSTRRHPYIGVIRTYLTVNDGKILDRWVPFTIPVSQ